MFLVFATVAFSACSKNGSTNTGPDGSITPDTGLDATGDRADDLAPFPQDAEADRDEAGTDAVIDGAGDLALLPQDAAADADEAGTDALIDGGTTLSQFLALTSSHVAVGTDCAQAGQPCAEGTINRVPNSTLAVTSFSAAMTAEEVVRELGVPWTDRVSLTDRPDVMSFLAHFTVDARSVADFSVVIDYQFSEGVSNVTSAPCTSYASTIKGGSILAWGEKVTFDDAAAKDAFVAQFGGAWRSVLNQPEQYQAVKAALAGKAVIEPMVFLIGQNVQDIDRAARATTCSVDDLAACDDFYKSVGQAATSLTSGGIVIWGKCS